MGGEVCLVSANTVHVTITGEPEKLPVSCLEGIGPHQRIVLTCRKTNQKPQAMLRGLPLDKRFLPRR
jgi:hypothetical protein